MAIITLTTRESIQNALDLAETTRSNDAVDRANESASEAIERELHRSFRPTLTTREFDWPHPDQRSSSWRLWLGRHELISLTALTIAGVAIPSTDWILNPTDGPPYDELQINQGTSADGFSAGTTWQRSISATGLYGYGNDETSAGATAEALDASETSVDVNAAAARRIGVGDIIRVDSERMRVTGRTWLATSDTLAGDLAASMSAETITVADGTAYAPGELVQVDSETMLVTETAAASITVRRAWRGSLLAAHTTGATINASRTLEVERGELGTTAATHTSAASIARHRVPRLVDQLTVVEALVELGLGRTGAAVEAAAGAGASDASGGGVAHLWKRCKRAYGRHGRFTSVGS